MLLAAAATLVMVVGPMRPSLSGTVCWLMIAAAVGVTIWHLPGSFRATQRAVESVEGKSRLDRELIPARSFDIATEPFVVAKEVIPEDATFAFISGPKVGVSSPLVLSKGLDFAGFWLLPRRITRNLSEADWIVSYGGELAALGLRYSRVIEPLPGLAVAEVRR